MSAELGSDGSKKLNMDVAGEANREGSDSLHWLKSKYTIPALVIAITFLAYAGTLRYEFVYDDIGQIVENTFVQSWQHVPLYFSEHVWNHMYPNVPGNYYRPVFLLWLLINHTLFGLSAWGWHLTTLMLHLVTTLFVFLIAKKLTGDEAIAGFASLIFGLHPVHIEAVAWVSGVTEPLLAAFLLPAFFCFLLSREGKGRNRLFASLVLYAFALLSKETAVIFPAIIFVHQWIFEKGEGKALISRFKQAIKIATPYLALTAIYFVARVIALEGLGHPMVKLPLSTVLFTWPSVLWFYIRLLIWPFGLSAFYDTPYIDSIGLTNFYLPLAGVVLTAVGIWWTSRRSAVIRFAAILMVLPLLPLLNLSYFIEGEIAHDRYLYLPSIGLAIIAAIALRKLSSKEAKLFGQPAIQMIALIVIAFVFTTGTVMQSEQWASDILLYHRGATIAPNNNTAVNNLANELFDRGDYEQAIDLYKQVLGRRPDFWLSNYNIAYSYYKLGHLQEAEEYFRRAISMNSIDADQHVYLGLTLMKMNRLDEAAASIRHALEVRPQAPGYRFALGTVLKRQGNLTEALAEFKKELINNPQQAAAQKEIVEIESGTINPSNKN